MSIVIQNVSSPTQMKIETPTMENKVSTGVHSHSETILYTKSHGMTLNHFMAFMILVEADYAS
ncbi:hypothetical protein JCM2421_17570 [Staphylococcus auricularis]|nr:hypothetical protein JCM2421_17570 [Staphylococcus auricularis]